jgi:hypothetical protein
MLLTVLLLVLGISFLGFCQRDLQFQRRQQEANQAQNLARSGIEFYLYLRNKVPSEAPPSGAAVEYPVITNQESILLQTLPNGTSFIATGRVYKSNGDVAVERAIVVPQSNSPTAAYTSAYDRRL